MDDRSRSRDWVNRLGRTPLIVPAVGLAGNTAALLYFLLKVT